MRADQRKFHYIYKVTRVDGKYYIGMHSTDDLEDGYFGSGQLLWKSIKKHGKEKHSKEILEFLPSRRELKDRERVLVNEEILDDPRCMNLRLGGEGGGGFRDPEHQRKTSLAGASAGGKASGAKNMTRLNALGLNKRESHATFTGRKHSEETKARMRATWAAKRPK